MKRVADHLSDVLEGVRPLQPIDVPLLDAYQTVTAEDVVATRDIPEFDMALCDGYAVVAQDLAAAADDAPVRLPVVGEVQVGDFSPRALRPGLALRIDAGAQVPPGATAVLDGVPQGRSELDVVIHEPVEPGENIWVRGRDVRAGDAVMRSGAFLGAAQIGLLAALGRDHVRVRPRPRVVVISTGPDLVEPGLHVARGQTLDSNSFALTAAATNAGAVTYRVGAVPNDVPSLAATIEDQLVRADLILISGDGPVSGPPIRDALARLGSVSYDPVAMHPGGGTGFGWIGDDRTPVFTLPLDPVAAFVSFEVFVRPCLRRMFGSQRLHRDSEPAFLQAPIVSQPGMRGFLLGRKHDVQGSTSDVTPLVTDGLHRVSDLAYANALIVVPEHVTERAAGDAVDCLVLERPAI